MKILVLGPLECAANYSNFCGSRFYAVFIDTIFTNIRNCSLSVRLKGMPGLLRHLQKMMNV